MNPFSYAQVRQSSDAEIQALEALCERLQGFGLETSLEWVDGFLCALAAGIARFAFLGWLLALVFQGAGAGGLATAGAVLADVVG